MGFWDNFPGMNTALMATFGEAVTYTSKDGQAKEIRAFVAFGEDLSSDRAMLEVAAEALIEVLEADIPEPSYQDQVRIGEEEFTVVRRKKSAGVWKLEIRRDLRPTFRRG